MRDRPTFWIDEKGMAVTGRRAEVIWEDADLEPGTAMEERCDSTRVVERATKCTSIPTISGLPWSGRLPWTLRSKRFTLGTWILLCIAWCWPVHAIRSTSALLRGL